MNKNSGLKPVANSLDVRTTAWGELCCLDIGFRHIVPPQLGTINNINTVGYSCQVFSFQMIHSIRTLSEIKYQMARV